MEDKRKRRLDQFYGAMAIIAEGSYVFVCDMKTNLSRWSKAAVDYFDLPDEYMIDAGSIWEEYIHPDDREIYNDSLDKIFAGQDNGHDMQYRAKARDGQYVVCTCRGTVLMDAEDKPEYFVGAIKNHGIVNYVDDVTGLRSLYGFFADLSTVFWKKECVTIMEFGISGFSKYNDIFGYNFGNDILTKFARHMEKRLENRGMIYRLDGVKFAIMSNTMTMEDMKAFYERARNYVAEHLVIEGKRVGLQLNAGAVYVDNFDISDKTVYSCLRYAYYESKTQHIGDFVEFSDELNDDNKEMLEKLNEIRNSVSDDCSGFFLCYQPIMFADSQNLKGMEALIRWKNEKYGIVPPVSFIPVLEHDAVFPKLGRWILKQAMTDGKKFLSKYPDIIMNVNLSYAQLEKEAFVKELLELLEETEFPAENLCLEITERCRLIDTELLKNMINTFHNYGIKVALDDFGTGYSSLGVLRDLPIDTVKIDRSYVKNIEDSKADQGTVKFIAELAEAFDAEVCVEGVESEAMIGQLKNYKVNSLQGYYFSKPIPFDRFMELDF